MKLYNINNSIHIIKRLPLPLILIYAIFYLIYAVSFMLWQYNTFILLVVALSLWTISTAGNELRLSFWVFSLMLDIEEYAMSKIMLALFKYLV